MHPHFARPSRFIPTHPDGSASVFKGLALALAASASLATTTVHAAQAPQDELLRLDAPSPTLLPDGNGQGAQISPDGQWTLFRSSATNLAPLPGAGEPGPGNLFLRDGRSGSFFAINRGPAGELLALGSGNAMVSRGALATAFVSASDVPALLDTNGRPDIYVYDRLADTVEWVSSSQPLGTKPLTPDTPSISDDGNLVAWGLTDKLGLTGKVVQLAVHDRAKGTTQFITPETEPLGSFGGRPLLSGDGTKLFYTEDLKVTPGFERVLKVLDLSGGGTQVLAQFDVLTASGGQHLAVSGDGERIAFVGQVEDVPVPANWNQSLYLYDFASDTLSCIAGCAPAENFSYVSAPSMSSDGRYVGYNASGPGHPDALLAASAFDNTYLIHDTEGGVTYDVLVNASGQLASNPSKPVKASNLTMRALSDTGERVAFDSNATNLALPIEPVLGNGSELRLFQRQLHDDGATLAFGPLVAGATTELEVSGASASAMVLIGVSTGQGPTATPYGLVQLAEPWTITQLFTDASGTAQAAFAVPPGAAGMALFAQGLDLKTDKRTAPVTGTVQ